MKKKIDLALSLIEKDGEVILKITSNGKCVLSFQNDDAPAVKVIGFKQPTLTKEQLLEFAQREAYDYDNGPCEVLEHYVHCREKEIYNHVLELRKIMRKLVKAVTSANAATAVAHGLLHRPNK
jgi:hypothetical protein